MKGIAGKSAVVTGGTSGIGYATAQRLLSLGARVLIVGRNPEKGKNALKKLREEHPGTECHLFLGDLGDEQNCKEIIAEGIRLFGSIDFLVNNGFAFTRWAWDASRWHWDHVMEAGPLNYYTMIREFVDQHPQGHKGAVVNTSSISAFIAQDRSWTYNTAKGLVRQLTISAGLELAPDIRVNSISPAGVLTDEVKGIQIKKGDGTQEEEGSRSDTMLRRIIMPEECASAIVFLLSDGASAITGTDIAVDAGYCQVGPGGIPEISDKSKFFDYYGTN